MKEVVVLAFNNCLTSSVIGVLDVFEIANNFWKIQTQTEQNFFQVKLTTVNGQAIRSFNLMPITPLLSIDEVSQADLIIVPPVMDRIEQALLENAALTPWLKDRHAQGSLLVSICTGIFFLAETGLLQDKTVTTNPLLAALFHQRYPKINLNLQRLFIDENDILSAGPTYAFLDVIIYLVEKYCGLEVALQCAKLLLHDKNRSSQAPYFFSHCSITHQDAEIKQVQQWMEQHCTRALTIDSMAQHFHMSVRNLVRRFRNATGETPLMYLQRLRVELAKKKLEATQMNIETITYEVGYADVKSFGRLFKRYTHLSPTEYRKRFSSRLV